MNDVVAISLSGLRASMASFGAAASNIANMNSRGSAPSSGSSGAGRDGSTSQPHQPMDTVQTSTGTQGGSVGVVTRYAPRTPTNRTAYDPSSLAEKGDEEIVLPNVNLAEEMVRIAMAVQTFRANVAVMKSANQMAQSALDIVA